MAVFEERIELLAYYWLLETQCFVRFYGVVTQDSVLCLTCAAFLWLWIYTVIAAIHISIVSGFSGW